MQKVLSLRERSYQKELLDNADIPFDDIRQNMRELDVINTWLGGHKITINGFKKLLGKRKAVHICEIGCGDGNNLFRLGQWCKKNKLRFRGTGIDILPGCTATAKNDFDFENAQWIAQDYKDVHFEIKPDIIFSSLFCHHFTEDELVQQLQWMKKNAVLGFFINDLQRNAFAYHAIRAITRLFSQSYLVKNDAPLSVARGFHKDEWTAILKKAGLENYTIEWKWAFRYLIVWKHAGGE